MEAYLNDNFKKNILFSKLKEFDIVNIFESRDSFNGDIYLNIFFKVNHIVFAKLIHCPLKPTNTNSLIDSFAKAIRNPLRIEVEYIQEAYFNKTFVSHPNYWNGKGFLKQAILNQIERYEGINIKPTYVGGYIHHICELIEKYTATDSSAIDIFCSILNELNVSQSRILEKIRIA